MTLTLEEAAADLDHIIRKATQAREEIILTRNNLAVAKLLPVDTATVGSPDKVLKPRKPGSAKHLVVVPVDFDSPLDDFAEYQ